PAPSPIIRKVLGVVAESHATQQITCSARIEGGDAEDHRAVKRVPETPVFARALGSSRTRRRFFNLARAKSLSLEKAILELSEEAALSLYAEFRNKQCVALRLKPHLVLA